MAFFSKLKERLFKSSSKLDEGLEAIVDEGGAAEPEVAQTPTPDSAPAPADSETAPGAETAKPAGILGRLVGRGNGSEQRRTLDDDMLEQLEELLIAADMGVDTALRVTSNMAEGRLGEALGPRNQGVACC